MTGGEEAEETPSEFSWSVYILNGKDSIQIVAAEHDIDKMIPEDGTFRSGVLIRSGMDEHTARALVDKLGESFGNTEKTPEILS